MPVNRCAHGDFVLARKRIFRWRVWPPKEVKSARYLPGAFKANMITRRTTPAALVSAG